MLLERGIVVAKGGASWSSIWRDCSTSDGEPPATLSPRIRLLIEDMRAEWAELDRRIAALTAEFVARARDDEAARRLATIPGIGALNATALVAAIGTGETFAAPAIWPPGSASCPGRRRPAASRGCSASRSVATPTCARC